MLTIQEELIEDTSRVTQAKQVKIGIRIETNISDIMQVLEQVLLNSQLFSEDAVNDALKVISQLTDWNSLDHFTNPNLIELYATKFLQSETFQCNAFLCLDAIVQKGADSQERLRTMTELINYKELVSSLLNMPLNQEL